MAVSAMQISWFPRFPWLAFPKQDGRVPMITDGVASLLGGIGIVVVAINISLALFIAWHLAIEVRSRRKADPGRDRKKA
jgi:hypothetical protein